MPIALERDTPSSCKIISELPLLKADPSFLFRASSALIKSLCKENSFIFTFYGGNEIQNNLNTSFYKCAIMSDPILLRILVNPSFLFGTCSALIKSLCKENYFTFAFPLFKKQDLKKLSTFSYKCAIMSDVTLPQVVVNQSFLFGTC